MKCRYISSDDLQLFLKEKEMKNRLLAITRNTIPYVPDLMIHTGSAEATILMQQLEYWFEKKDHFYKFLEPADGSAGYTPGDSWTEELRFTPKQFRTAFGKIGIRYGSVKEYRESTDKFQGKYYCSYYDRLNHKTWYFRNHGKVKALLDQLVGGMKVSAEAAVLEIPVEVAADTETTPEITSINKHERCEHDKCFSISYESNELHDSPAKRFEDVLSKFENVRRSGSSCTARCPAHDDRKNSLSISLDNKSGKIMMKCHAGCTFNEVCDKSGVHISQLFPPAKPTGNWYVYRSESGEPLYRIRKNFKKSYSCQHFKSGGWHNGRAGVPLVLYNLPSVLEARKSGKTIYVVEGEKDAETLMSLGYVATTSPFGASNWNSEFARLLGNSDVVVIVDRDESGYEYGRAVEVSMKNQGVVRIFEPKVGKDITDHVEAGLGMEDIVPVDLSDVRMETYAKKVWNGGLRAA